MTPLDFTCPHCGLKMFVAEPGSTHPDAAIDATIAKGIPVLAHQVPRCAPYDLMTERVARGGKLRRTDYWRQMAEAIQAAKRASGAA